MHAARALPCYGQIFLLDDMQFGRGAALPHREHVKLLSRSRYVCMDICEEDAYATYEGAVITCYST